MKKPLMTVGCEEIVTSRVQELQMEKDWYIDALDTIEDILSQDSSLERKIKQIEDVLSSALNGEPTTADPYNRGDDIEYSYED